MCIAKLYLSAPKDLYNTEQNRTLPSIAAFFLPQQPMTNGRVYLYHPVRGISAGVTFPRAWGSVGERFYLFPEFIIARSKTIRSNFV
jgi:hypothetical protein